MTPLWFLRKQARLEPWFAAMALVLTTLWMFVWICVPHSGPRPYRCTSPDDPTSFFNGSSGAGQCHAGPPSYVEVPLAHVLGRRPSDAAPWVDAAWSLAGAGLLLSLALVVGLMKHLRSSRWRDLSGDRYPGLLTWLSTTSRGGTSISRPATRPTPPTRP